MLGGWGVWLFFLFYYNFYFSANFGVTMWGFEVLELLLGCREPWSSVWGGMLVCLLKERM